MNRYSELLGLVDTRGGEGFPDLLERAATAGGDVAGLRAPTPAESRLLRPVRDRLCAVVLGTGITTIDELNELLVDYRPVPRLSADRALTLVAPSGGDRVAEFIAVVLSRACDLIVSGDIDRLGICDADRCIAPFVDTSKRENRRFCSARCATRMRVRDHRHRSGDRGDISPL